MSALNPYAVTPERRTDSKPFRRRLVRKTGFGSCRRKLLQKYFRQSFESSPGVQRVATLWGTPRSFRTSEKNKTVSLTGSFEVFQTSNPHTQNNDFAQTQLNPFAALGGIFLLLPQHFFAAPRPLRRLAATSFSYFLFVKYKK